MSVDQTLAILAPHLSKCPFMNCPHCNSTVRVLIFILLSTAWGSLSAADPALPISSTSATVTPDKVKAKLKEVEASTDLGDSTQKELTELLLRTLSNLEKQQSYTNKAAAFKKARETAPTETKEIKDKLERATKESPTVTLNVSKKTPIAQVDQSLLKEKANQAAVEAKLAELQTQLTTETDRPTAIRQRIIEIRQIQDQIENDLKQLADTSEQPALIQAKRWDLEALKWALSAEIRMLDQELISQPMRIDLLEAQRDSTERTMQRMNQRVSMLEQLVSQLRRTEAEKAKEQAEDDKAEMAGKHPLVVKLAEENAQITNRLSEVSAKLEKSALGDQSTNTEAKRIEEELVRARKKLEIAGLSQVLGRVLMEQRRQLPNVRNIRKEARAREKLIADIALSQIQDKEQLSKLRDINGFVNQLTAAMPVEEAEPIRSDLIELAKKRRDLLEKAIALGEGYLRSLGELDFAQNRLIEAVQTYDDFLAERLLWVRNSTLPNLEVIYEIPAQIHELVQPERWLEVVKILLASITQSPIPILVLIVFLMLMWQRGRMRTALEASGKKIIKPRHDKFRFTLQALALTLLLAAPWPLLLATIGWQLGASLEASPFTRAVSNALIMISPAFFYLEGFRIFCLPGGLAETHFRWLASTLKGLRRQLGVLMMVFLPSALIAILAIRASSEGIGSGLGRLAFIMLVISLSYFFYRLFGPGQETLAELFERHPSSALARFRYLWLALALVLPLILVVLAVLGFLYTAGTLFGSLVDTLWLVLGFILIHQLAVRWLLMTRRKLAFEAALERRRTALAAEQKEAKGESEGKTEESEMQLEEPEIDLFALNQESRKLVNAAIVFAAIIAMWFIWSELLPAFGFLEQVSLWHRSSVVQGETQLIPVTLADMLLALLVGIVTIIAAKRFPSLLEIILLKRSWITSGGRYAATNLSKYSIATLGILLSMSLIGASWSQIQWLAAALSVGIGFGLQEIVANFISGIIILFERPIRVGDVVTVGDTDGVVTRIKIRATTIRNWDRQELLVPNKEFITSRLLNWSLSDQTTRIKVPVGVAYGSDVNRAMELMNQAAKENDKVLEDPSPTIIFRAFGDNTLNLELRCFVAEQDDRLPTMTALHHAINEKFNQAGIVIAFPQRDIHLDTSQPLELRIHRSQKDSAEK